MTVDYTLPPASMAVPWHFNRKVDDIYCGGNYKDIILEGVYYFSPRRDPVWNAHTHPIRGIHRVTTYDASFLLIRQLMINDLARDGDGTALLLQLVIQPNKGG